MKKDDYIKIVQFAHPEARLNGDGSRLMIKCPYCGTEDWGLTFGDRDAETDIVPVTTECGNCYRDIAADLKDKIREKTGKGVPENHWKYFTDEEHTVKTAEERKKAYQEYLAAQPKLDVESWWVNEEENNTVSGEKDRKEKKKNRRAKKASDFEDRTPEFLWEPYLPIGNFTVLMASGGTGKSVFTCGVAAAISAGKKLPGMTQTPQPKKVLFISAEDTGEEYKQRLKASGANLDNIIIVDKHDSKGLSYLDGEFEELIAETEPALVVVDPWHGFAGNIDINRINIVRPLYQAIDLLASKYHTAMILISHVNKKAQDGNANNAAIGSVDFINASRSALQIIFDTEEEDSRILVHTKINHKKFGDSLKYRIIANGGIEWTGTSAITRWTLEEAAGKHKKPQELVSLEQENIMRKKALLDAVNDLFEKSGKSEINVSYQQFRDDYGDDIFGGRTRPKKCFEDIELDLYNQHITFKNTVVGYQGKTQNGLKLLKTQTALEAGEAADIDYESETIQFDSKVL